MSETKRKKPHYLDEPVLYAYSCDKEHPVPESYIKTVEKFRGCRVCVRDFYTKTDDPIDKDYFAISEHFYVATLTLKSGEVISLKTSYTEDDWTGDYVFASFTYENVELCFKAHPNPNKEVNGTKGWIKWMGRRGGEGIRLRLSNNLVKFVDGTKM